jgi:hypothetical protein
MGIRRALGLAVPVATVVALTLAGCTATPEQAGTPTPSASTFGTLTVTPSSLVPLTCDAALADGDASSLAGEDVAPVTVSDPVVVAVARQAGDLRCDWAPADDANATSGVQLEVRAHADVLAADPSGRWATPPSDAAGVGVPSTRDCDDPAGCTLTATVSGFWVRVAVHRAPGDASAPTADPVATLTALVARLRSAAAPSADAAQPGTWPTPVDCQALSKAARVGVSQGLGKLDVKDASAAGDGVTFSDAVAHLGGRTVCLWTSPVGATASSTVTATTVSGGSWAAMSGKAGGTALGDAVDVGDDAIGGIRCGDDGCAVTAAVGQNLVRVSDLHRADADSPSRAQVVAAARLIVQGLRSVYPS